MGLFTTTKEEEIKDEAIGQAEVPAPEAPAVDPDFEDRSLYNCDVCGGDGLVRYEGAHEDVHCPQCQGKGKLN